MHENGYAIDLNDRKLTDLHFLSADSAVVTVNNLNYIESYSVS